MRQPRTVIAALAAGAWLGAGSVAHADINRDLPTRDLPTISEPVYGTPGTADAQPPRTDSRRYVIRMRLDDGRYRGFRQHGTDELRTDDRVIVEQDRIRAERRAQRNGTAYR